MSSTAGRPRKEDPGVALTLRVSTLLNRCLEQLADLGLEGTTRQEIVRLMIIEGVRTRIGEHMLSVPDPLSK
jgi:hypothetical protein